jgi:ectoine hydroxylase-related dioxygenase (phytanoyl-CoA dioxygenase family)
MTLNTDAARFAEDGYIVLPEVLDADEARALYAAFDALPGAGRRPSGIAKWNERVLLRDRRFFDAITRPRLLEAITATLGDDLQLLALDALETPAGSGRARAWHPDFAFWSDALLTVNCAIYLQDMTPEAGPLHVIPGSHRWRREPSAEEETSALDGEVAVEVEAGTAVVFNAMLWHSGGRNETARPRRAVFPYFGHYWIKRMDDFYRDPLPDYVLHHEDPVVRQLFGLELAVASVHGGYDARSYG